MSSTPVIASEAKQSLSSLPSAFFVSFATGLLPLDDACSIGHALRGGRFGEFWRYRVGDFRMIAYAAAGDYTIVVKAIDILGNDTTKTVKVTVE